MRTLVPLYEPRECSGDSNILLLFIMNDVRIAGNSAIALL